MYNCWLIKFLEKSLNNSSFSNICYFDRLATMVSIIVFSLSWKFGVFIVTSSLCLMVFIFPSLATLFNGVQSCNHDLGDRSFLFIPVPTFHQNIFSENSKKNSAENIQKSRIINKVIACILIVLVVALQYLITKEVIPFLPPDLW